MKKYLLISTFCLLIVGLTQGVAQEDKSKRKSPPAQVTGEVGSAKITIDYSQPSVKGRTIWGDLVKYDKVWRTGANEATTFEVSADIKVEGKTLKAGKYALFTIPGKDSWTIIFNSESKQWGAYKYDESKDVLRVTVKPADSSNMIEQFTISMVDQSGKKRVVLGWDKLVVPFTVSE